MNFVGFYGKCIGKYTSPMDPMGYTGCLIGILIMVQYNPHMIG